MKVQFPKRRNAAWTLIEVVVVLAIILLLAIFMLPPGKDLSRVKRMRCVDNLKQISEASMSWAYDNNGKFPMQISVTNGGAMELVATGNVVTCFRYLSNELWTPKILICPADTLHTMAATNFADDLDSSHISYFISADADKSFPQRLLSGDDNFVTNGVPAKSGLFEFPSKEVFWGPGRHGDVPRHFWTKPPANFVGNISFSDGSVSEVSDLGLEQALVLGLATNRFVIP